MNEKEKWMEEREVRKERVAKTIRREEVSKTPFMLIADGYYPAYLGIERSVVTSFDIASDINSKVDMDLHVDTTLFTFDPANLMTQPIIDILGGGSFVVKDYQKMQSPKNVVIMEAEEYPELIKDPAGFLINTIYSRRFELLRKDKDEQFNGYLQLLGEFGKQGEYRKLCEEKGSHIFNYGALINPVDIIFDFLREFSGIINDIKRSPDLVRDAGLAIGEGCKSIIDTFAPVQDKAIIIPMHIPAFLRPKDFEKVYWPSFKLLAEYMVEKGHNIVYYFEKNYEHLYDYLQELPKRGIIGIFQEDNLINAKKKLGNTMAIAGGLSTAIMKHGAQEQCIDHVKGLIDDLAPGGGYFIAPDTPMMFPVDAKPENLKAIADYIFES